MNAEDYWKGWDCVLLPLQQMAQKAGLTASKCQEITGVGMFPRWFTRSQFQFIGENHYLKLQSEFPDAFSRSWDELKKLEVAAKIRSYFDNSHDIMRDVWQFPRVTGAERWGHATPKPVKLAERVLLTSVPEGGIVLSPFGGTAPELIAAENTGRSYRGIECEPTWAAVILERFARFTGSNPEFITE